MAISFDYTPSQGQTPASSTGILQSGATPFNYNANSLSPKAITPISQISQSPAETAATNMGNVVTTPTISPLIQGGGTGNPLTTILNAPSSALNFASGVATQPIRTIQQAGQAVTQGQQMQKQGIDVTPMDVLKGLPEAAYKVLTPKFIQQVISGDFQSASQSLENDPIGQVLPLLLSVKGAASGLGAGEAFNSALGKSVETIASPVTKTTALAKDYLTNKFGDRYVAQAQADWARPATTPKPGFSKATNIYKNAQAQGNNIGETLLNNKILPQEHIVNGHYNTADTADQLKTDAGKATADLLRPSLKQASYTTEPISTDTYISRAVAEIQNNKSEAYTPELKQRLIGMIQNDTPIIAKEFKGGLSLENLLDEKILRDKNAKYNETSDTGKTLEAQKNKALADAARSLLLEKSPPEVPVKEVLKAQTKQYQAASYLDALHGKKAVTNPSLVSKGLNYGAKVGGLLVGHHLVGGLLGGLGGYHLGGVLESFLTDLPNPVKQTVLDNLQKTNLPAFEQIKAYLGEQETNRLQQKTLPSPSYIPLKSPQPKETPGIVSQAQAISSRNPKTGRFDRSYTSEASKKPFNKSLGGKPQQKNKK